MFDVRLLRWEGRWLGPGFGTQGACARGQGSCRYARGFEETSTRERIEGVLNGGFGELDWIVHEDLGFSDSGFGSPSMARRSPALSVSLSGKELGALSS